jgi:hypothetical protein
MILESTLKIYSLPHLLATTMIPLTTPERPHQLNNDFATPKLPIPSPKDFNLVSCSAKYSANGAKTFSDTSIILIELFE